MSGNVKRKLACTIECPYCSEMIAVFRETETLSPAIPADRRVNWVASKSVQTKLVL
jgi:hypothetical protein